MYFCGARRRLPTLLLRAEAGMGVVGGRGVLTTGARSGHAPTVSLFGLVMPLPDVATWASMRHCLLDASGEAEEASPYRAIPRNHPSLPDAVTPLALEQVCNCVG